MHLLLSPVLRGEAGGGAGPQRHRESSPSSLPSPPSTGAKEDGFCGEDMIKILAIFLLVLGVTTTTFAADIDIKQLDRDRVLKAADQFVHDDPITVTAFVC